MSLNSFGGKKSVPFCAICHIHVVIAKKRSVITMNTKKSLDFSTKVNGIHFHIRATKPAPLVNEYMAQTAHMHYTWEFQYLFDGEMELQVEGKNSKKKIKLNKGQLCLIPPGCIHSLHTDSVTRFCFNMMMEFDSKESDGKIEDFYRLHNVFSSLENAEVIEDKYASILMDQFREIYEGAFFYPDLQKGFLLVGAVMRIFDMLYPKTPHFKHAPDASNSSKQVVDRKWIIEEHIANSYQDEYSLSSLAKKLYLSERQARVVVHELMGDNYKKLITQQRMSIANVLIASSSTSLSDIAFQVGYRSYNGFYIAYTKFYGITPEEAKSRILREQADRGEIDEKIYVSDLPDGWD